MSADQPTTSLPIPANVDVLSVAFSSDNKLLCCGCSDGQVRQFYVDRQFKPNSALLNSAMTEGRDMKAPVISMEFRPETQTSAMINVLATVCVDGNVVLWHLGMTKKLCSLRIDDEILAGSFSPSGDVFAVGGRDSAVHLLDASKLAVVGQLTAGDAPDGAPINSGRIQSMRFYDENTIVTCGWGHTLRMWDRRTSRCVASIYGPYVCGDGIDISGNLCAVASYREEEQLQLWDLAAQKMVVNLPWKGAVPTSPVMLFCCKFSPSGLTLIAGGNEGNIQAFDTRTSETRITWPGVQLSKAVISPHTVNSLRWSPDGKCIAAACSTSCTVLQSGQE